MTYSYWDGKGHRRTLALRRGDTIGQFLGAVKAQLAAEFREIRSVGVDGLLYVKEDLIIPHHYSFHECAAPPLRPFLFFLPVLHHLMLQPLSATSFFWLSSPLDRPRPTFDRLHFFLLRAPPPQADSEQGARQVGAAVPL